MQTDDTYRVLAFEEKPLQPRSNLGSMGIYVFSTDVLNRMLREDDADPASSHDFGKNIIPKMIQTHKVYAFPFSGYWVDVGTVQAYWEAHMDFLADTPLLDLLDRDWVLHTRYRRSGPR